MKISCCCMQNVYCMLPQLYTCMFHVTCRDLGRFPCMLHACNMHVTVFACYSKCMSWCMKHACGFHACYMHATCLLLSQNMHVTCIYHACYMNRTCMLHVLHRSQPSMDIIKFKCSYVKIILKGYTILFQFKVLLFFSFLPFVPSHIYWLNLFFTCPKKYYHTFVHNIPKITN